MAHPLLQRARSAVLSGARFHREYPVRLELASNKMLEGIVDLAFVENGSWVIVDFKTDAYVNDYRAQYERQLQWYAFALEQITGMRARAHLLAV